MFIQRLILLIWSTNLHFTWVNSHTNTKMSVSLFIELIDLRPENNNEQIVLAHLELEWISRKMGDVINKKKRFSSAFPGVFCRVRNGKIRKDDESTQLRRSRLNKSSWRATKNPKNFIFLPPPLGSAH